MSTSAAIPLLSTARASDADARGHPPQLARDRGSTYARRMNAEQRRDHEKTEPAIEDVELPDDGEVRIDGQHGRSDAIGSRAIPVEIARERIRERNAQKRERAGPEPRGPLLHAEERSTPRRSPSTAAEAFRST